MIITEEMTTETELLTDEQVRIMPTSNIGGNTVTRATAHLPEDQRGHVRWLHDFWVTKKWTQGELAKAVDLNWSTIYRVFTDSYRQPAKIKIRGETVDNPKAGERIDLDNVCEKIAKFRKQAGAAFEETPETFVETDTFKRIEWLCLRVKRRHSIGFIYSDSHLGKTWSLEEVTRRYNGGSTIYAEMPPASGVQLMLKYIAKALHVSPHTAFDHLLDDVMGALDESKLLILDEIHRVFTTYQKGSVMRCLDTLRHIHDRTKCGLVLCGTNVFRDQMSQGLFFNYLKQLKRRGASFELQLPNAPTLGDMLAIAESRGLSRQPEGAALELIEHIAREDGLGGFCHRLEDALDLAKKRNTRATWAHLVEAYAITEKSAGRTVKK